MKNTSFNYGKLDSLKESEELNKKWENMKWKRNKLREEGKWQMSKFLSKIAL